MRLFRPAAIATGLLAASAVLAAPPPPAVPPPAPYGAVPSARQVAWHELEAYAFVHFTVDTFTDKEWGFGDEKPAVFNPTAFDADQIVRTAKAGGLKGLIITGKHHDGFCLWPSKYTEHSVKNSPWKEGQGDVLRELSEACKKHGLKFGVYLSPWDRHHPDYGGPGYVDYYHNQIREVCSNYGPLFEMWFDGACGGDGWYGGKGGRRQITYNTYYGWKEIRSIIRELQPECAIWCGQYNEGNRTVWADARWGGSEAGFVNDPCWSTLSSTGGDSAGTGSRQGDTWCGAEADVSIRPGWFWHQREDDRVKSPAQLMEIYLQSVGRGANLILNLPPDRRGLIHENDAASLELFGKHLEATFATNLAVGAKVTASNVRGGDTDAYGPARLLDPDRWSAWTCDDGTTTAETVLDLGEARRFNLVRLREDIRLGQRVDEVAVDAWDGQGWKELAKASSVGVGRLWRVPETTAAKVRIRVTKASASPALSDFGLFLEPPIPVWAANPQKRQALAKRGTWTLTSSFENNTSPIGNAIDGDPASLWNSYRWSTSNPSINKEGGVPLALTLDLGKPEKLQGITYLPRQDRCPNGIVDQYSVEVSVDGQAWTEVARGEFANIRNNPIEQTVSFPATTARLVRFTALHVVAAGHVTVAELGVVEAP